MHFAYQRYIIMIISKTIYNESIHMYFFFWKQILRTLHFEYEEPKDPMRNMLKQNIRLNTNTLKWNEFSQ